MVKAHRGHFFEDFHVGSEFVHAVPRTITEGDAALYIGLTGSRYPLHCSCPYAQSLGYQRETINDLLLFHIIFGKTVNDISLNAVANLGYAGVRFLSSAYPGDTFRVISRVLGKKENKNAKTGIVWVKTTGVNQNSVEVLEFYRWVMVHKRNSSQPTGASDRPAMPQEVTVDQLVVADCLRFTHDENWATGGSSWFEDYQVGQKIDHIDGMTIEESEHAIATRLYQNTAKVHFDAVQMKDTSFGRRLIYGGHIISVARELSFNGLENAIAILAWNSGSHANPTFAGDTIYAYSEVLACATLPTHRNCGALRVQLVGLKNISAFAAQFPLKIQKDGKTMYHPNVVLDLDYWLLVPRRQL